MTADLPPEFPALASLIDAQPAPACPWAGGREGGEAFCYCLALAMVEASKARLVGQEPREAGRCAPSRRWPASGSARLRL